jgi:hypothetical protein
MCVFVFKFNKREMNVNFLLKWFLLKNYLVIKFVIEFKIHQSHKCSMKKNQACTMNMVEYVDAKEEQ